MPDGGRPAIKQRITVIGDGIENPHNAQALLDAAAMFGCGCLFRNAPARCDEMPERSLAADPGAFSPLLALDNIEGAPEIYGFRLPAGPAPALAVGNERSGLSRALLSKASHAVQIPMAAGKLNCLNVAAAAGVALYYLSRGGGRQPSTTGPLQRRPEVLLMGAGDHVELGSSIRSAGAFGWRRIWVEDRAGAWFGGERPVIAEGRAAARRHRNPIAVAPCEPGGRLLFEEVCVITTRGPGLPLPRVNLARGPRQLIVIPDEGAMDAGAEDWERLGASVSFARIDLPVADFPYRYRLAATIALAEAARQVGKISRDRRGLRRPSLEYDRALELVPAGPGELVWLEDLIDY